MQTGTCSVEENKGRETTKFSIKLSAARRARFFRGREALAEAFARKKKKKNEAESNKGAQHL